MRKGSPGKCKAFPNGIPNEVWDSELAHRQAIEGDNTIQFELIEDLRSVGDDMRVLLEAMEMNSETGLRMAIDMIEDGSEWRWDVGRYPKIKPDEEK